MVQLPMRPPLAVTPEKLEDGTVNLIIRRGYSDFGGLKWKSKSYEREYLTRLCRSMIDHGAPAHHLEENLTNAAERLGVELAVQMTAESILLSFSDDIAPTLPLISGDWETVHLAHLHDIYRVHDAVIDFRMRMPDAIAILTDISEKRCPHSNIVIVLNYGLICASIAPLNFGARFLDIPPVFCLGLLLGIVRTYLSLQSSHRDVLEILIVLVISFVARWLGTLSSNELCFSALAQTPLVLILPGYTLACGSLQLMSTNKGAGSSRVLYSIIQAVVLGFSVTMGTSLYGAINPAATSLEFCQDAMPANYCFFFLLPLVVCITILSQARWQQIPIMCLIMASGWLVNNTIKRKVVTEVSNLVGAFVLGALVNTWSGFLQRSAAEIVLAGLITQLPLGMGAHGSMVGGLSRANLIAQPTSNGTAQDNAASLGTDTIIDLRVPCSMARVAIMLALGLRLSSWCAYVCRQKRLNC